MKITQEFIDEFIKDVEAGKYDEWYLTRCREYELSRQQRILQQMSKRISISDMPGVQKWSNIKVLENEPHTFDTYVPEFLNNYLVGLENLRQNFNRTKDMAVYDALMTLMPAGLYFAKYETEN